MTIVETSAAPVTDAELLGIFQPVFERIRTGAVAREQDRRLPFEEIGWLRAAGFGRLRVSREHGGFGATVEQLVLLLIGLGAADSNIPQALRGHIGFTEYVLAHPDQEYRDFWFAELAGGALVGNAESERTGTFTEQATRVAEENGRLLLNGTKYYTTGSIFADWILVSAAAPGTGSGGPGLVTVQVRADAAGVDIVDDWDGFGQRLTGSGTTGFSNVEVDRRFLQARSLDSFTRTIQHAVYQLVHLAALSGIAEAALAEITGFVRGRSRNLFNPTVAPAQDPVVLQVVGETFGTVETVKAAVLAAARTVQQASTAQLAGTADGGDFAAAEAHVYGVQATVIDLVLRTVSRIFEVGGASATSTGRQLDRLWRNARTISSHNPAIYRQQAVGDYVLNGVAPAARTLELLGTGPVPRG
ncbi:acyl-CoA dehydrogenase [Arthrobacter sp. I2-34]|uniref:Acyl-CoA dehydrogenase n=1 Tax=Arthrobacter hankyongi TaxID=2904801 RepID=A0ABS9L5K7_9MICC|nr:acyl-CoA dehydrogenase [Arthrobacter hankyongi]MCG2621960.1 acyl-CoA dehydrogenase [Arthrobacter hankyongi]